MNYSLKNSGCFAFNEEGIAVLQMVYKRFSTLLGLNKYYHLRFVKLDSVYVMNVDDFIPTY